MARLFRACCMLTVLCLVTAQTNEDLESLLSQVYPESGENTTTKNPPSAGESGGINLTSAATGNGESVDSTDSCTCVPYYLCKPNPSVRVNTDACENYFNVCCVSGDIVELKPESDRPPQK